MKEEGATLQRRFSSAIRRKSSRKRKSEKKFTNPMHLEDLEQASQMGYLKLRQVNNKEKTKKYWFILHGSRLSSFKKQPNSTGEAVSLIVDTVELDTVEEIKVEKNSIVLKFRKENKEHGNNDGSLVRMLTVQKSRAQQFLRRSNTNIKILQAENSEEAQEWMHAMHQVSIDSAMLKTKGESSQSQNDNENIYISSMKIKSRKGNDIIFSNKNLETTLLSGLGQGKRVGVKQLIGTLPESGFIIEVEISNGCKGTSMVFRKDEFIEYDEEKQKFDDGINLNFTIEDDYQIFLEMERENLSVVSKTSTEYMETLILSTILEYDVTVIIAGVALLLQLVFLILTRSIWSILLTASAAANVYNLLPTIKSYLLDKLQPYFISSVTVKKKVQIQRSRSFHKDESITNEEYELLYQLREAVSPIFDGVDPDSVDFAILDKHINTDYRLVRYLRARNDNVDKAARMIREAMNWRLSYGVDNIVQDNVVPEWLLNYGGCSQFTELVEDRTKDRLPWYLRDKDYGNLAVLARTGGINQRKLLKKLNNDTALLFHYGVWVLEFVAQDLDRLHEETNGANHSYLSVVLDLKHFSLSQQLPLNKVLSLAKNYLPIITSCYPEILERCVIINAPVIFYSVWNVIYPLLPERVVKKVEIHGSKNNLKYISRVLNISQIPRSYGGELSIDGDEMCLAKFPSAGPFMADKGESLLRIQK